MREVVVRDYCPADSESIVLLHNKSEEFFEEADITIEFIQAIAERDDYKFFIAEKDGKVMGYCGVLYYRGHGRAEIGPIVVSQEYRHNEYGRQILETVLSFLKEKDIHRVVARVKYFNLDAQKFFIGVGFEQEGHFKKYTKKKEDVIQYVKFL